MNQFERLEALAQRVIEGTFGRWSGQATQKASPLPPVETKEVLRLSGDNQAARQWRLHNAERTLPLGEPVVTIGRALDNDIVLSDPTVSRYHAQLRWRQGRYYLCPPQQTGEVGASRQTRQMGQSSPYTLLNGQDVLAEQCPLNPGDELTMGKTTLTLQRESNQAKFVG